MNNNGDLELIKRCRDRDQAALGILINRYQRAVYNAAYRLLGNIDDARDVTQVVFMKVWEHVESYNPKYKFFSWIYRIAVNESLNLLRRKSREQPMESWEMPSSNPGPEVKAQSADIETMVQSALMHMKLDDRVVLVLRHFSECRYREIAAILDIPEKTVKSRLFAARRRMRELLSSMQDS